MWIGDKIYYNSDRDGKFNLYAYDVSSAKTAQVTNFKDWEVRWASSDDQSRIVYERNGELEILDTKSNKPTKLNISVPTTACINGANDQRGAVYSKRCLVAERRARSFRRARRHFFRTGGKRRNQKFNAFLDGARQISRAGRPTARASRLSPTAVAKKKSGLPAQDGLSQPEQLTTGGGAMRYAPEWSGRRSENRFFR
jgi:tricorn protease